MSDSRWLVNILTLTPFFTGIRATATNRMQELPWPTNQPNFVSTEFRLMRLAHLTKEGQPLMELKE